MASMAFMRLFLASKRAVPQRSIVGGVRRQQPALIPPQAQELADPRRARAALAVRRPDPIGEPVMEELRLPGVAQPRARIPDMRCLRSRAVHLDHPEAAPAPELGERVEAHID